MAILSSLTGLAVLASLAAQTPVMTINGWQGSATDFNDSSIFFKLDLSGPTDKTTTTAIFDTGAVALQIPMALGESLGLPYQGSDTMTGLVVGAVEDTYDSHVNFSIDGREFDDVPCVVGGKLNFVIFGMQFVRDHKLNVACDFTDNTVVLTETTPISTVGLKPEYPSVSTTQSTSTSVSVSTPKSVNTSGWTQIMPPNLYRGWKCLM